jgi:cytochrome c-type protein NapB
MEMVGRKIGKVFNTCIWILLMCLGFILFTATVFESKDSEAASPEVENQSSGEESVVPFKNYDPASNNHLEEGSKGRTLSQYYSRRQYSGAPPEIPHPLEAHGIELECLTCHANGGWTEPLKRITPVTPHPEMVSCMQCHIWSATDTLFRDNDWQSFPSPRIGRSYLPGAPTPIPHALQMRENCNACHVGPGTVVEIRMKHQWWGNCQQCHVHDRPVEPFRR